MSSLVKINGVHKYFTRGSERIDVLKGVSLDIPQGDFLALMGPSGSGKTTLLNLLGGLDQPSGGTLEVGGTNIGSLSGGQLSRWRSHHIGFVFQLYNLLPVLTAERNVELPLLLAAGEFCGAVSGVVGQADELQGRSDTRPTLRSAVSTGSRL